MKNFFAKTKNWIVNHLPTKRRIIQLYAALLYNANLKGFATGKIYTGDTKYACVPGLNCYSCPGAVGACPMGALQDSLAGGGMRFPAYILGVLLLFGLLLGRIVCGFLCPFGLIQELLYKIRSPKLRKNRFTRILSYFKYVVLAMAIFIPIIYAGIPAFCKYICPAGTMEGAVSLLANIQNSDFYGMLGYLFTWKFVVLVVVVAACVFIYRAFCRFVCPLGAIYGLFCKVALLGVKLDKNKCIDCGLCIQECKMDIKHVGDHECIQCGECIPVCPVQAISWKGSKLFVRNTLPVAQPAAAPAEKIDLLSVAGRNAEAIATAPAVKCAPSASAVNEGKAQTSSAGGVECAVLPDTSKAESDAAEDSSVGRQTEAVQVGAAVAKRGGFRTFFLKFRNRNFVLEFTAWVLAVLVLISAVVYYALEKTEDTLKYGVGDKAPMFTLQVYDSEGEWSEFSTMECKGKVTVINYWYTMCDPCKAELPYFESVFEEYNGEINMFAVHSASALPPGGTAGVQKWLDEEVDKNGRKWNSYKLTFAQDTEEINSYVMLGGKTAFPMTVILDKSGVIDFVKQGACSEQELREAIINAMN